MEINIIETKNFKIDGGAMFGVVPKTLWSRYYPADELNLCACAARSLLIKDGNKKILVDSGIGNKLEPDIAKHYHMFGNYDLITSLKENNTDPEEITDVILTHLHFDHCGGNTDYDNNNNIYPVFPNANIWISKDQCLSAKDPNLREKPAFIKENIEPLEAFHKINQIEKDTYITENVELRLFNGHTSGLISVFINHNDKKFVFAGDLLPAVPYIRIPYISAYDILPLKSIDEKQQLLNELIKENGILIFQHDYYTEACDLKQTNKGIRENNKFKLKEIA